MVVAKNNKAELERLRAEYGRILHEKTPVAEKLLAGYYAGEVRYRKKRDRSYKVWEFDIAEYLEKAVVEFLAAEEYFIEALAKLCGEIGKINPFERRDGESLTLVLNWQLRDLDLPPIEKWEGLDAARLNKAMRRYRRHGYVDELEEVLYLAVREALVRWTAILGGKKTVPLKRYAKMRGESVNAVRNKARRQTIPAFRKDGKWLVVME